MSSKFFRSAFISSIAVVALSSLLAGMSACGKFDEDVNAKNLHGTVVISKALVGTNAIGMVYVGVYSGLDTRLGYASPIAAPASSSAGADTFPYGGTSLGSFYSRDARFVCTQVTGQTLVDAGANWEMPFDILQFPFHSGATVWAFADRNLSTCNGQDGYRDNYQYLINLTSSTAVGADFLITTEPTDLSFFNGADAELIDEAGHFWKVLDVDDNPDPLLEDEITVTAVTGESGSPFFNGTEPARIYIIENPIYYGTQFQNVLNFPTTYIELGDLVSSEAPAGSKVITDLSDVTITIDTVVP